MVGPPKIILTGVDAMFYKKFKTAKLEAQGFPGTVQSVTMRSSGAWRGARLHVRQPWVGLRVKLQLRSGDGQSHGSE